MMWVYLDKFQILILDLEHTFLYNVYMKHNQNFREFLKRGGRTDEVAERVVRLVKVFADFQYGRNRSTPESATESDLDAFIEFVEQENEQLPKHDDITPNISSYLWALRYFYQYCQNNNLAAYTAMQREKRIKRKPFLLKDFRGIQPEDINALAAIDINNSHQMLKAGSTHKDRQSLASKTGLSQAAILELVKLSDLARIPGIKGIRARLYHDAGIDSVQKLAQSQVEEVLQITQEFVAKSGFDGIAPLPAEVSFSIKTARTLPDVVEYA